MCKILLDSLSLFTSFRYLLGSYCNTIYAQETHKKNHYCMMVLQRKYCHNVFVGAYKNVHILIIVCLLPYVDPNKEICNQDSQ